MAVPTLLTSSFRALFVKNLSYSLSAEDLFELFAKFGPVSAVVVAMESNH